MLETDTGHGRKSHRDASHPRLFYFCGVVGILGCVAAVLANIVGVIVQPSDGLIADTISANRRRPLRRHHGSRPLRLRGRHPRRRGRPAPPALGQVELDGRLLAPDPVAVLIVVIAAHGEYGDGDPGGLVIHLPVVGGHGARLHRLDLLTAAGFYHHRRRLFWFNIACAVLWVLGAAAFWFSPTCDRRPGRALRRPGHGRLAVRDLEAPDRPVEGTSDAASAGLGIGEGLRSRVSFSRCSERPIAA